MRGRDVLKSFREGAPHIFPSLLRCDFGNLEREVRELEEAGITALHLDVMDGLFVPNLTYGMPLVAAFRQLTDLPLDVHLMIERPERYLQQFADAGADVITVHVEACEDVAGVLGHALERGVLLVLQIFFQPMFLHPGDQIAKAFEGHTARLRIDVVAVGTPELRRRVRRHLRMTAGLPDHDLAVIDIGRNVHFRRHRDAVMHGCIDMLTLARPVAIDQRN